MPALKTTSVQIVASVAWWWPLYRAGVLAMVAVTGRTPTPQTIRRVALRAVRTKVHWR